MNTYQDVFELHAQLLKSLSHPKRLEIVHLIRDRKLSVGQIQQMLDLPQANLSQHLKILKDCGVLICQKKGKQIIYELTHSNFLTASDLLRQILQEKYQKNTLAKKLSFPISGLLPSEKDPVCGMYVSPQNAAYTYQFDGAEYYFCASRCHKNFSNDPEKYIIKN